MKIFRETKKLVKKEKQYTAKILKNLMLIEKNKLYCDLKYNSLFNYIVKELGYTQNEAALRVNAVRLMIKSRKAVEKIETGSLSLTNASIANRGLQNTKDKKIIDKIVEDACSKSTRDLKNSISKQFKEKRQEILVLDEHLLRKMDRLRKQFGDISNYELIQILLEDKLKTHDARVHGRNSKPSTNYRTIPKFVKAHVYNGKCSNCGGSSNLEYDHKIKFSHGGTNDINNIQMLCRNCNQRKEIKSRQTGFFT
jgi:hypothetical protein